MAYNDWVDTEPILIPANPKPDENGEIYGYFGVGWYFEDENGMLVGGPHTSKAHALNLAQHVKDNLPHGLQ